MKLATFTNGTADSTERRIGSVDGDTVVDLTAAYTELLRERGIDRPAERAAATVPPDMLELLRGEGASMDAAHEADAFAAETGLTATADGVPVRHDLGDTDLLSPLPRPPSLRDFSAFEQHVKNGFESYDMDVPEEWYNLPVCYKGNPDAIVHPDDVVDWPPFTDKLDYELELAAVIGKQGRNVRADEADDYIAGYTVFNDFSARDIQAREMSVRFGPGKGKDFANGLGPYLVTPDEFDLDGARMTARVNGEVWSDGTTDGMYHSFGDMIEYTSWGQTIYPGDVYGSGTIPFGCGKGLGRWLDPGDELELEVEGIGVLRHTVGERSEPVERDYDTEYEFHHR